MPIEEWFRAGTERVSFFTVHWKGGQRLTLPYAAVVYMVTIPAERFVIMGPGIKIVGRLGDGAKPVRRELETAAESLTGGRSYAPQSTLIGKPEVQSPTGPVQNDPDDLLANSLKDFQEAFQNMFLRGVFHQPDARVSIKVYQRAEDGWEEFVP